MRSVRGRSPHRTPQARATSPQLGNTYSKAGYGKVMTPAGQDPYATGANLPSASPIEHERLDELLASLLPEPVELQHQDEGHAGREEPRFDEAHVKSTHDTHGRKQPELPETLPGAVPGALLKEKPGAWMAFLREACERYPMIGSVMAGSEPGHQEADPRMAESEVDEGENLASVMAIPAIQALQANLLERFNMSLHEATMSTLREWRRLEKTHGCSCAHDDNNDWAAHRAMSDMRTLEMKVMRQHALEMQSMLTAATASVSKLEQLFSNLQAVKARVEAKRKQKVAADLALPIQQLEKECLELRELRARRNRLNLVASARTCEARTSLPGYDGIVVLVFRGGHRLRLGRTSEDSSFWARFEPKYPDTDNEHVKQQFEDHMYHLWLEAAPASGGLGATAVGTWGDIGDIVGRLDTALTEEAAFLSDLRVRGGGS